MTDPRIALAALLAALSAGLVARHFIRPERRLAPRVEPYAQPARVRLGLQPDADVLVGRRRAATVIEVFGPALTEIARRVQGLLAGGDDDHLARRLAHAGIEPPDARQFRLRQTGAGAGYGAAAAASGLVVGRDAVAVLLLAAAGAAAGVALQRGRLQSAIERRRERMRTELYTLTQLLAMLVRSSEAPLAAIRRMAAIGSGPVAGELATVSAQIAAGSAPDVALEQMAESTAEPAAARLYRLLATATAVGGDLAGALLAVSADLRAQRREDLEREAIRRRGLMVAATLFMAPVMVLFVAAPIPTFLFNS